MPRNAIIYIRVSTADQVQGTSLDTQLAACQAVCEREDMAVAEVYRDEGESAKTIDRPGLMAAMARAKRKDISAFVVYRLDRLSRRSLDYHTIQAILISKDVQLLSATEVISDDPSGRLQAAMLSAFAQFDNEVRGARARAGMQARAKAGWWVWTAPYGYKNARTDDNMPTLSICADDAPVIRDIFRLAGQGVSHAEIARRIGGGLSYQSVFRFLNNPAYAGLMKSKLTGPELVPGNWPALVDPDTFFSTCRQADKDELPAVKISDRPEFPLRGWLTCAKCGKRITASYSRGQHGKRYAYYHCHDCKGVRASRAAAHDMFCEQLEQCAIPSDLLDRAIVYFETTAAAAEKKARAERVSAHKKLGHLHKRKDRLLDLYLDKKLSCDVYAEKAERLSTEIAIAGSKSEKKQCEHIDIASLVARVRDLVESPARWWQTVGSNIQRAIQSLYYPVGLVFDGRIRRTAIKDGAATECTEDNAGFIIWHARCVETSNLDMVEFLMAVDRIACAG